MFFKICSQCRRLVKKQIISQKITKEYCDLCGWFNNRKLKIFHQIKQKLKNFNQNQIDFHIKIPPIYNYYEKKFLEAEKIDLDPFIQKKIIKNYFKKKLSKRKTLKIKSGPESSIIKVDLIEEKSTMILPQKKIIIEYIKLTKPNNLIIMALRKSFKNQNIKILSVIKKEKSIALKIQLTQTFILSRWKQKIIQKLNKINYFYLKSINYIDNN